MSDVRIIAGLSETVVTIGPFPSYTEARAWARANGIVGDEPGEPDEPPYMLLVSTRDYSPAEWEARP